MPDFLIRHPWQRNVRELQNLVSTAVILSQGKRLVGLDKIQDILPHKRIDHRGLNPKQKAVLEIAKEKGIINTRDLQSKLNIPTRTLRRYLSQMAKTGLLISHGSKKDRYYTPA